VQDPERVLGVADLRRGRDPEQLGASRHLGLASRRDEKAGEVVGRGRLPGCGGLLQPGARFRAVGRHAAAVRRHEAERRHSVAVAVLGGEPVPAGRLRRALAHAEPLVEELGEQRHGGRVRGVALQPQRRLLKAVR
jgi:hypothetical protein